jgi:cell shape-determining protein MreD
MNGRVMKFVLVSTLTLLFFMLEPVIGPLLGGATTRAEVLCFPVVAAVIACPGSSAVVLGAFVGLVCDCLAGAAVGPQMAAFALIAAVASLTSRPKSVVGIFVLSFACAAGLEAAIVAIRSAQSGFPLSRLPSAVEMAVPALVTAIVMSGLWLAARQLTRPFARRPLDGGRFVSIGWQRTAD